jgi:hypothetical protein
MDTRLAVRYHDLDRDHHRRGGHRLRAPSPAAQAGGRPGKTGGAGRSQSQRRGDPGPLRRRPTVGPQGDVEPTANSVESPIQTQPRGTLIRGVNVVWVIVVCVLPWKSALAQRPWRDLLGSSSGGVSWEIRRGRLAASLTSYRQNYRTSSFRSANGHRESVRIDVRQGVPRYQYEYVGPKESFRAGINENQEICLAWRQCGDEDTEIQLRQRPGQTISFRRGPLFGGDETRMATLWHLWFSLAPADRADLEGLLEWLLPDGDIAFQGREIQARLLDHADGHALDLTGWRGSLEELDADSYAVRQAASDRLANEGLAAIGFVRSLDPSDLTPEQRFRLRGILRRLESTPVETSNDMALALLSDQSIWSALSRNEDVRARRLANQMLGSLGNTNGR